MKVIMSTPNESINTTNTQVQSEAVQVEKEKNFALQRKMYERQLEEERRSKQELEKKLQEYEASKRPHKGRDEDADDDDDSEPYVDKRTLKKQLSRFAQDMGQDIDRRATEKAAAMIEQERQVSFLRQNADFNQILNEENIQKFAERHPEIAEQMVEMPDNFARKKLLYQNIKALGIHKKDEPKTSIQDTVNKNQRNPYYQPSSAGATPPYAMQGDFSSKGQENAYAKMKELIRNRRG